MIKVMNPIFEVVKSTIRLIQYALPSSVSRNIFSRLTRQQFNLIFFLEQRIDASKINIVAQGCDASIE